MLLVYTFTNIIIVIVKEYYFGLLILLYNIFYTNLHWFSYWDFQWALWKGRVL